MAEAANKGMGTVAGVAIPVLKGALAIYQVVQIRYIEEQRRAILRNPELAGNEQLMRVDPEFIASVIITLRGKGLSEMTGDFFRAVADEYITVEQITQK